MKRLFLLVIVLWFTVSAWAQKPFPVIDYSTPEGPTFTNTNLLRQNSIIILFHLGCPAAMYLLKDLESLTHDEQHPVQIIGILENTNEQIRQFNDTLSNDWSDLRQYFKLKPVTIPLYGECPIEKITVDEDGNKIIEVQCRILSKKIKTRYSPTLVYVNRDGNITRIKKGYLSNASPLEKRLAYLLDKF